MTTRLRSRARLVRAALVAMLAGALLAGCTGGDGGTGGSFTFVSPDGKQEFAYAPAERGTVGNLSGPDLAGEGTRSLGDYAGEVVVVNFWGSWCSPCRAEADELEEAAAALAPAGVRFLGVNVQDTQEAGADFLRSKGVTYPSIYDPAMRTLLSIRGYPTSGIPSTLVIDRQGRVAHIWLYPFDDATPLVQTVSAIAAEV